jgi:hypothetical protein
MTWGMRSVNNTLAKAVNSALGRKRGTVLADRYHERHLTSPRQARNALAYVLNNYRHHGADRGERLPQSWIDPFSSARFFDGFQNRSHDPPGEGDPVASPKTWMIQCGWKKGGLISTAYVPGPSQNEKN